MMGPTAMAATASRSAGLATAADLDPRPTGFAVAADSGTRSARCEADRGAAAPRAGLGFGDADAEAESVSGLSAEATPTTCGPASDSPSAKAAVPTRTAFLVLLIPGPTINEPNNVARPDESKRPVPPLGWVKLPDFVPHPR